MSGIAHLFTDADLNPTKDELAARFGGITELLGSYRLVDPDGQVGIEILIGRDEAARMIQLPLTYRSEEVHPEFTLSEMEHSELGHRFVSNALGDPVAVREIIRTIVQGDDGAAYSAGPGPVLSIRGSGDEDAQISDVELREVTRQRALGSALIDGTTRPFLLRISNLPGRAITIGQGHTTPELHLAAHPVDTPEDVSIIAELNWRDLQH